jgi:hypothetical protein
MSSQVNRLKQFGTQLGKPSSEGYLGGGRVAPAASPADSLTEQDSVRPRRAFVPGSTTDAVGHVAPEPDRLEYLASKLGDTDPERCLGGGLIFASASPADSLALGIARLWRAFVPGRAAHAVRNPCAEPCGLEQLGAELGEPRPERRFHLRS